MEWKPPGPPRPTRALMSETKVKTTLICFLGRKGIEYTENLAHVVWLTTDVLSLSFGTSEKIDLSCEAWIVPLQHDNAPSSRTLSIKKILAKGSTMVLKQPPCSPDVAPRDCLLSPTREDHLEVLHFESMEEDWEACGFRSKQSAGE
jgi:hypothetical protein